MLDDGGNGADGQRVLAGDGHGDLLLIADAEVALADGHERGGRALGRLDDLHVQALLGIVAVLEGDVHAGMVGVGHIVKDHGDVLAKAEGRHEEQEREQGNEQLFHTFFSFFIWVCGVSTRCIRRISPFMARLSRMMTSTQAKTLSSM